MKVDDGIPGTLPGDVRTVHRMRGGTRTAKDSHIWRGGAPDCGAIPGEGLDKWSLAKAKLGEWDEWHRAVNCPGCLGCS
ncbi:hypothetical protein [Streptomyces sp. NPDC102264]|uniref:hypothetical protein n=1 Tax=Streptomyces sp. NPDC102264 TaxID=3366149 RepID=UPI0037F8BB9F